MPGLGVAAHVEQCFERVAVGIQDEDVLLIIGQLGLMRWTADGQALRCAGEGATADRVEPKAELDGLRPAGQVVDDLVAGGVAVAVVGGVEDAGAQAAQSAVGLGAGIDSAVFGGGQDPILVGFKARVAQFLAANGRGSWGGGDGGGGGDGRRVGGGRRGGGGASWGGGGRVGRGGGIGGGWGGGAGRRGGAGGAGGVGGAVIRPVNPQGSIVHIHAGSAAVAVVIGAEIDPDPTSAIGQQVELQLLPGAGIAALVPERLQDIAIGIEDEDVLGIRAERQGVDALSGQVGGGEDGAWFAADGVDPGAELGGGGIGLDVDFLVGAGIGVAVVAGVGDADAH